MIQEDFATTSDSFYFAEGNLIVHNKAAYSYAPENQPGNPDRVPRAPRNIEGANVGSEPDFEDDN